MKNNKFLKLIWPILYLILVLFVCSSGSLIFHSYYYKSIFVDGESMYPTLNGGTRISKYESNFGIIDPHEKAINAIERYDIITTYYPWDEKDYSQTTNVLRDDGFIDYNVPFKYVPGTGRTVLDTAYYKIKRVVGVPGDVLRIKNGEFYLLPQDSNFYLNIYDKTDEEIAQFRASYGSDYEKDLEAAFVKVDLPYERHFGQNINIKDTQVIQLHKSDDAAANEYFVIGDNWGNSTDCATKKMPIYRENIVGVLVAIEGKCKIVDGDSSKGNAGKTCEEREYFKPIFF